MQYDLYLASIYVESEDSIENRIHGQHHVLNLKDPHDEIIVAQVEKV